MSLNPVIVSRLVQVRQAAQAGQVPAQLALAQMHMDGKGTPADPHTALPLLAASMPAPEPVGS